MSWLADYFRRAFIRSNGAALQDRDALNFIGFTVADNPTTKAIDITAAGGGSTPTGTGFVGVTLGAQDAAAIKVDLASATYVTGTLAVGNGGTGVTSLGAGIGTWLTTPSSANLAAALTDETGTGSVVFSVAPRLETPSIWNTGLTFRYIFGGSAIVANRTITLPLLTGDDTFMFAAHAQAATNKTIVLASNTVTDTSAATGDLAKHNGTRFVRMARGTAGQFLATNAAGTDVAWSSNASPPSVAVAALAIDWSAGLVFTKTLGAGGNTFTFSNAASGMTIIVRLTGAASTVTWPTVRWAGGVAPTQTASGTDVYTFVHDGTSIYGSVVQAMA